MLIFLFKISVLEYVQIITLISVIIGGVTGLYQWWRAVKVRNAELIDKLVMRLRTDEKLKAVTYLLEYNKKWYVDDFHNSDSEQDIDYYLSFYSYICYLIKNKHITKKDAIFFEYHITIIAENEDMKKYLSFLYSYSNMRKAPMAFKYLYDYFMKKNLLVKNRLAKNYDE